MIPSSAGGVWRMLVASSLFAAMGTFVAAAHTRDPGLSTSVSSAFRAVVNLLVLVAMCARRPAELWGDGRPALWLRGVGGGVALICYFASLERLSAGEAAFLNYSSSVWVAAAAPFLLGERVGLPLWGALLGSLGGVWMLAEPRDLGSDGLGRALGLGSGLAAAVAYLSIRRAGASNGPIVIVFYFTLVSSVLATALVLVTGATLPRDTGTIALLVAAGLAATIAQLFMTEAYRLGKAAVIAAAGGASPLLTVVAGWALLGQVPDTKAMAGMAILAVTGVALPYYLAR